MTRLDEAAREAALKKLPEWRYDAEGQRLGRSLKFADFSTAFAFMTRIAIEAEKADHHPDWSNSWNRVDIWVTTHSEGGVTEKDVALAKRIDEIAP